MQLLPKIIRKEQKKQGGHEQCQVHGDVFFQLDHFVVKYEDKTNEEECHHSLACYKTQLMCISEVCILQ